MDRLIRFGTDVVNGWLEAGAFTLAAALAYYAIFSIAPLLLISIHLASLFLDRSAAVEGLTKELVGLIGRLARCHQADVRRRRHGTAARLDRSRRACRLVVR